MKKWTFPDTLTHDLLNTIDMLLECESLRCVTMVLLIWMLAGNSTDTNDIK